MRSADLCVEEWFKKRLQYKGKDKLAYGVLKHNSFTTIYFTFDNAQALRGILSVYRATGKKDNLELAKDIARWEMKIMQNPDGSFKLRYEQGKDKVVLSKEVYQARVYWELAELWRETGNEDGSLYFHYNSDFTPQVSVMERTGQWEFYNADEQLAHLCYYLFKDTGEERYLEEGDSILEMLYSLQEKRSENTCIRDYYNKKGL